MEPKFKYGVDQALWLMIDNKAVIRKIATATCFIDQGHKIYYSYTLHNCTGEINQDYLFETKESLLQSL